MVTWREWLVRKPKSIREALVVLPVAVAVIGLIWLGTTVSVHLSGPRQCSDDLWDDPDAEWIHAAYLVRREMFTRQYEDHWIVVMRAVPKALSSGDRAMLVVCHYETFNHVYSHFEILDPEQLDHIREVSSPTFLHPLTGYQPRESSRVHSYSEIEWKQDVMDQREKALMCPDCGSDVLFRAYGILSSEAAGAPRIYRGCKVCGFWQDVGEPPYRCVLTVHWCTRFIDQDHQCASCDCWAVAGWRQLHPCWRVARRAELKGGSEPYTCDACATTLTDAHVIPWLQQPGTKLWVGPPYPQAQLAE